MGCLNSQGQFDHWFGNIHFSGPCNRSCYFCIGQHMMDLDPFNNLRDWPLPGIDRFVENCLERGVNEINLTGSNTDPTLYRHLPQLRMYLEERIPNLVLGLRTNAAQVRGDTWRLFDKGSISITTLDPDLYTATMGQGKPPNIREILGFAGFMPKVNIVLCPETVESGDWLRTVLEFARAGYDTINLREPYGQPHIGDPFALQTSRRPDGEHFGMPYYLVNGRRGSAKVTYWDVHYVEVESVNLYANGRVSETYPITEGHSENGTVQDQGQFTKSGRVRDQWITLKEVS